MTDFWANQFDSSRRSAIIVDIDGTLAKRTSGREFWEWDRVGEDSPNWPIMILVRLLVEGLGHYPIFVSGRDEVCRETTIEWLSKHDVIRTGDTLLMRKHKDNRPDDVIKLEIYKRDIEPYYHVAYVFDDRNKVVKMWREQGLTVLQVADGNF